MKAKGKSRLTAEERPNTHSLVINTVSITKMMAICFLGNYMRSVNDSGITVASVCYNNNTKARFTDL